MIQIDGVADATLEYRVYLNGVAGNSCGTATPSWTYYNDSDVGAKAFTIVLALAKATGKTLYVYSNKVGAYCHIMYLTIGS